MRPNDRLPMNEPFPLGNWIDPARENLAEEWLASVERQSHERFFDRIEAYTRPTPIMSGAGRMLYINHASAVKLCKHWDGDILRDNRRLATSGYEVAFAFNRETGYLPTYSIDFSEDLNTMRREPKELARRFAQTAWHNMSTYMYVHDKYERLFRHAYTRFYIASETDTDIFKAGMALPYIIGWASGLADHVPNHYSD